LAPVIGFTSRDRAIESSCFYVEGTKALKQRIFPGQSLIGKIIKGNKMSKPATIKLEDFLLRQLLDPKTAGPYLEAMLDEEGLTGLQRGIKRIMQAHNIGGELTADPLQNLALLQPVEIDPTTIDQLKAAVLHLQSLPQPA
jgi:hypothetical protein